MTKPRNFPERKRQKTADALARMHVLTERNLGPERVSRMREIAAMPSQRDKRTKKDRSAMARFRRAGE